MGGTCRFAMCMVSGFRSVVGFFEVISLRETQHVAFDSKGYQLYGYHSMQLTKLYARS